MTDVPFRGSPAFCAVPEATRKIRGDRRSGLGLLFLRAPLLLLAVAGCRAVEWRPARADGTGADSGPRILLLRDTTVQAHEAVGRALTGVVRLYQGSLRGALASRCSFYPSCSNYMIEAIRAEGPVLGFLLGVDRWLRDHPFSGGYPGVAVGPGKIRRYDPVRANGPAPRRWTPLQDPAPSPRLAQRAERTRARLRDASDVERNLFAFAVAMLADPSVDPDRAGIEFRRFLSYHPESSLASDARILGAIAALHAGRAREAASMLAGRTDEPLERIILAYARFQDRAFAEALLDLDSVAGSGPEWTGEALSLRLLIEVTLGDDSAAAATAAGLQAIDPDRWGKVATMLPSRRGVPGRSPTLAGLLSAVVPGSGQLYAGRAADGAVSLVLTGLFTWAAAEAFHEDVESAGAISGAVALVFYASGVAGAARAAEEYNHAADQAWLDRLGLSARGPEVHWTLDARDRSAWERFGPEASK